MRSDEDEDEFEFEFEDEDEDEVVARELVLGAELLVSVNLRRLDLAGS